MPKLVSDCKALTYSLIHGIHIESFGFKVTEPCNCFGMFTKICEHDIDAILLCNLMNRDGRRRKWLSKPVCCGLGQVPARACQNVHIPYLFAFLAT